MTEHKETIISPQAIVSPQAKLGQGVVIEPYAIVEPDTEVGDGTHIYAGAIVKEGSRIGSECHIHSYAIIGGVPQDLKFVGEKTLAIVGDRTSVREFATINRGTASRGFTKVGNDCLIMTYTHVAHDCVLKDHIILGNSTQVAGEVQIDDYAILSGASLVHQFVQIGAHTMIQGGSRIVKDIPPYTLIGRDPAVYCGINIVGLRRRQFTNNQIFLINDIYRTLYTRGLNNTKALKVIEEEHDSSPIRDGILDFIKGSQRGIIRGSIE